MAARSVKPKEGYGAAYLDWRNQEFGIAAAFSGDRNMQAAYMSGDPYLAWAKQTGAAPQEATKDTHPEVRDLYKRCVLGVQYCMGPDAMRIQKPRIYAQELLRQHREVFRGFWEWSDNKTDVAQLRGWQQTTFGWTSHVSHKFNERSVRNFPMQAHGAEMLRLACCLGIEAGIEICAPVHDALLIQAPLERLEEDIARMRALMEEASRIVLGGFTIHTEIAVKVRYPDRFRHKKGEEFWNTVMSLLEEYGQ